MFVDRNAFDNFLVSTWSLIVRFVASVIELGSLKCDSVWLS